MLMIISLFRKCIYIYQHNKKTIYSRIFISTETVIMFVSTKYVSTTVIMFVSTTVIMFVSTTVIMFVSTTVIMFVSTKFVSTTVIMFVSTVIPTEGVGELPSANPSML